MIDIFVQCIGWKSVDDRDSIIKKEHIIQAIPKLKTLEEDIKREYKGSIRKYVEEKGINTPHDVMVLLRRMLKENGHYVTYMRGSKKGTKKTSPVYLYKLI